MNQEPETIPRNRIDEEFKLACQRWNALHQKKVALDEHRAITPDLAWLRAQDPPDSELIAKREDRLRTLERIMDSPLELLPQ